MAPVDTITQDPMAFLQTLPTAPAAKPAPTSAPTPTVTPEQGIREGIGQLRQNTQQQQAVTDKFDPLYRQDFARAEAIGEREKNQLAATPMMAEVDLKAPQFQPSEFSNMFSVAMIASALLGRNSRNPAETAMSSLTGMINAKQKGDEDDYARQYQTYKDSVAKLKDASDRQIKKRDEIRKESQGDLARAKLLYEEHSRQEGHELASLKNEAGNIQHEDQAYKALLQHSEDMKKLDLMIKKADAQIAASQMYLPPESKGLTGQAFLNTLDPGVRGQMEAIHRLDEAPPPTGSRSVAAAALNRALYTAYPDYDATMWQQKFKTMKSFASDGVDGKQIQSINTSIQHLDLLQGIAEALNNSDTQLYNKLKNRYVEQFGSQLPTNLEAAKHIVGPEVVKAIVQGGGGVTERLASGDVFSDSKSFDQIKGAVDTTKGLLSGQLKTKRFTYEQAGGKDFVNKFVMPDTQKALGMHDAAGGGITVSSKDELQKAIKEGKLKKGDTFKDPDGVEHTVH